MSSSGDRIKKGQRMNFCLKVCGPEVPPRESLVLGKSSGNHPHQRLCLVWSGLISEKGRKWRGQDPFCITRDLESCLPTQITHHYSVFPLTLFCPLNHELVKVLSKSLFLFPHPAQCLTHTCVCVCACVCVCICVYVSLTLCDPMDCTPPGSSVHGILQARILEWVVMPSSRGSSWRRDGTRISCIAGRFSTVCEAPGI